MYRRKGGYRVWFDWSENFFPRELSGKKVWCFIIGHEIGKIGQNRGKEDWIWGKKIGGKYEKKSL